MAARACRDGVLYVDRVDTATLGFLEETERYTIAPKPSLAARITVVGADAAVG